MREFLVWALGPGSCLPRNLIQLNSAGSSAVIKTHMAPLILLQPWPRSDQAQSSGEARVCGSLVWSLGPGSPPPTLSTPLLRAVDQAQQEVLKIDDMKGALLNYQKRGN